MTLRIRKAQAGDEAGIRRVHLQAFPTAAEADLVEALKKEGDAILSLVADDGEEIVGHILFSRMSVEADGRSIQALALAPVAVLPGRQGRGVGSRLIEAGKTKAREAGTELIFVLGKPDFHGRFGFSVEAARPFVSPYAGPYFQALWLTEPGLAPGRGKAEHATAFGRFG